MFNWKLSGKIFLRILPKEQILGKNDIRQQSLILVLTIIPKKSIISDKGGHTLKAIEGVLAVLFFLAVVFFLAMYAPEVHGQESLKPQFSVACKGNTQWEQKFCSEMTALFVLAGRLEPPREDGAQLDIEVLFPADGKMEAKVSTVAATAQPKTNTTLKFAWQKQTPKKAAEAAFVVIMCWAGIQWDAARPATPPTPKRQARATPKVARASFFI